MTGEWGHGSYHGYCQPGLHARVAWTKGQCSLPVLTVKQEWYLLAEDGNEGRSAITGCCAKCEQPSGAFLGFVPWCREVSYS